MNTVYFNEFDCDHYNIQIFFFILICIQFFGKKVINNFHGGYCMHFISAEFDQIDDLQHFT